MRNRYKIQNLNKGEITLIDLKEYKKKKKRGGGNIVGEVTNTKLRRVEKEWSVLSS